MNKSEKTTILLCGVAVTVALVCFMGTQDGATEVSKELFPEDFDVNSVSAFGPQGSPFNPVAVEDHARSALTSDLDNYLFRSTPVLDDGALVDLFGRPEKSKRVSAESFVQDEVSSSDTKTQDQKAESQSSIDDSVNLVLDLLEVHDGHHDGPELQEGSEDYGLKYDSETGNSKVEDYGSDVHHQIETSGLTDKDAGEVIDTIGGRHEQDIIPNLDVNENGDSVEPVIDEEQVDETAEQYLKDENNHDQVIKLKPGSANKYRNYLRYKNSQKKRADEDKPPTAYFRAGNSYKPKMVKDESTPTPASQLMRGMAETNENLKAPEPVSEHDEDEDASPDDATTEVSAPEVPTTEIPTPQGAEDRLPSHYTAADIAKELLHPDVARVVKEGRLPVANPDVTDAMKKDELAKINDAKRSIVMSPTADEIARKHLQDPHFEADGAADPEVLKPSAMHHDDSKIESASDINPNLIRDANKRLEQDQDSPEYTSEHDEDASPDDASTVVSTPVVPTAGDVEGGDATTKDVTEDVAKFAAKWKREGIKLPSHPDSMLLAKEAMESYQGKDQVKPTSMSQVDAWLLSSKERKALAARRGDALKEKVRLLKARAKKMKQAYQAAKQSLQPQKHSNEAMPPTPNLVAEEVKNPEKEWMSTNQPF